MELSPSSVFESHIVPRAWTSLCTDNSSGDVCVGATALSQGLALLLRDGRQALLDNLDVLDGEALKVVTKILVASI